MNSLETAQQLATLGWRVLPIQPGQKKPSLKAWQHAATADLQTINNWFTGIYQNHGIGIATGPQPNGQNLIVVDIDEHDIDRSGTVTLHNLETKYGPLPQTVTVATGSGGKHIYLLAPPGIEIRNDAGTRLGVGIDLRGDGGQVLAPPTVHPNGTAYRWVENCSPWDIEPAPMPKWMADLICNPQAQPPTNPITNDGDGPASRYNQRTTWAELLTRDGWQYSHSDRDGEQYWTRPGKTMREGTSATVGYRGQDVLVVFTSSIPWLPAGAYSRFGYMACRDHNGDRSAAAKALIRDEHVTEQPDLDDLIATATSTTADERLLNLLIDWPVFWEQDHTVAEWLAEPLIAEARAHAIFAPGGTGKSLLALWLCAAIATGTPIFGHPQKARRVLYLDYEMTADDLAERLEAMGYTPEHNLSNLRYALLPDLESLDSEKGGAQVARLAELCDAELVVFDTFGRAIAGEENDADTVRAFYRNTGILLKRAGRAFVRIDHAGKDLERGQRGSSAKNDDVDIVWQMTRSGSDLYSLKTRKARMGWVPEKLELRLSDDPLRFEIAHAAPLPDGALALVGQLDALEVDPNLSSRKVRQFLSEQGIQASNAALRAAVKIRARHNDLSESASALDDYLL
jgi:hypothetical protein